MRTQEQVRRIEESNYSPYVQHMADVENGVCEPETPRERILAKAVAKFAEGGITEEELQDIRDYAYGQ